MLIYQLLMAIIRDKSQILGKVRPEIVVIEEARFFLQGPNATYIRHILSIHTAFSAVQCKCLVHAGLGSEACLQHN